MVLRRRISLNQRILLIHLYVINLVLRRRIFPNWRNIYTRMYELPLVIPRVVSKSKQVVFRKAQVVFCKAQPSTFTLHSNLFVTISTTSPMVLSAGMDANTSFKEIVDHCQSMKKIQEIKIHEPLTL